ncbi:MAG: hydantoinase B/oxoprolinase family protein [Candidatus Thalassarchaeaceae archaeon]|nr:hydantoinase [Euryarchaeota archaeon]MDP7091905.1 hydantoinase B/oxoprolinase family protein [Candidatus Thalassarchaeaceae archaeon]MBV43443.1 hydantoinase [Euryarchaeota archaeon]MDP7256825.1 hydantoinase B/oxoprolinase family protein [Candidatus Thalassarchaeaceae archaeon]MDP7446065.1 hydantoinase B/oxoprolinase family protein [Candidatus Thalassarchaeaceae archaeon]
MSERFDPITLEILWRRLISIVDEADVTVARTAFSSLLRDAHDYTCMFTDRQGRELAQGTLATPGQSGAMALGIKSIVEKFVTSELQPGDVFITNDPWALAGHLNDVCVLSPIFHHEQLVGFTACVFHHSDIGGRVASDNRDVFEEGLFIPLVKLYAGGKLNEEVLDMIRWNVRTPDEIVGDIRSQTAANHVCAIQVCKLLSDYKLDSLDDLADEIIERTEASMRASITELADGIYTSSVEIEQRPEEPNLTIAASIEVSGDEITVDLSGSSAEVRWGGNVVYNFTYAYVFMALKSMFDPEVPNNHGSAAPIRLIAPEGSVVNCHFPAAVAARMQIGHFLTEVVYRALSPALPDRVLAASGGTPATMNVFYGKDHVGVPWHTVIIRGGGMGASQGEDGGHCFIFPANGANTPVEILESETPLHIECRQLLPDSGGAGKQRGGLGRRVVFRVPEGESALSGPVNMGLQSGRFQLPPEGLNGGCSGGLAHFSVNNEAGDPYGLTQLQPGDVVTMDAAGGGGFGNPLDRELELVAADLERGYISSTRASEDYGVVLDSEGIIDAAGSISERRSRRKAQKAKRRGA